MATHMITERQRGAKIEKLTTQQQTFVLELLNDPTFNATAAAERAGYSNPAVASCKLMKHKGIAAILGKEQARRNDALRLDANALLCELSYQALRDPIDLCDDKGMIIVDDLRRLPERIRRCIDSLKVRQIHDAEGNVVGQTIELKLTPKMLAIELAMKHFGMFAPQEVDVKMKVDWDALYGAPTRSDPIEVRLSNVGGTQ